MNLQFVHCQPAPFHVYVLNYNDEIRRENIEKQLADAQVPATIFCFSKNDDRYNSQLKTLTLSFFNYVRMFEEFLSSEFEFGVFLEDDVILRRGFFADLFASCKAMKLLELDVLLVGYLIYTSPENWPGCEKVAKLSNTNFYKFDSELWGTQGFILTRRQAREYVTLYNNREWLYTTKEVLSADWQFTKRGRRLLQYPPLVIEEGNVKTSHQGQKDFHQKCFHFLKNVI